jgi:hypothetical protein
MVVGELSRAISRLLLFVLILGCAGSCTALAESRAQRAVLIGNNYPAKQYASELQNGQADAIGMKELLINKLGFAESDVLLRLGADRTTIREAWAQAVKDLTNGVAIFYFSGHGIEVDGENYLIPDGASEPKSSTKDDLIDTFVSFKRIMELFLEQQAKHPKIIGVFILDACRANPFPARTRAFGLTTKGLAPVQLPQNSEMFVMYAAGAGQLALDSLETDTTKNSLYTRYLLAELPDKKRAERLSLADLAQNIREHVVRLARAANHAQVPSYYDQLVQRRTLLGEPLAPLSIEDEKQRLPVVVAVATPAPRATVPQAPASEPTPLPPDCDGCPSLVVLPGGRIGSVQIGSLAFGKTEVTNREWNTCVKNGGCQGYRGFPLLPGLQGQYRENKPVTGVSWNDAQTYVKWLRSVTKQNYRLPTEAEWEYAARAKSETPYAFGKKVEDICQYANGADWSLKALALETAPCNDGYARETAPVATFRANAFGLHDMHGNVWEWVEGCWNNPGGAGDKAKHCDRVARGGSWRSSPQNLTSASRVSFPESHSRSTLGFRVVREQQP